jgi:hypothetical protein
MQNPEKPRQQSLAIRFLMTSFPELDSQSRFDAHRMGRGMGFRPIPGAASCRTPRALQFRNSQQVVRRRRQVGGDLGSGFSDEAGLSHSAHRLQPAEDLFNRFRLRWLTL